MGRVRKQPKTPKKKRNNTGHHHYDIPNRSGVKGVVEFMEVKGYQYRKKEIFDIFNVKHTQGYEILGSSSDRRHPDSETGGRKPKITPEQVGGNAPVRENP